jgi:hypothetical protein
LLRGGQAYHRVGGEHAEPQAGEEAAARLLAGGLLGEELRAGGAPRLARSSAGLRGEADEESVKREGRGKHRLFS